MRVEFVRPDLLYLLGVLVVWALVVWPWKGRGVRYTRAVAPRDRSSWVGLYGAFLIVGPRLLTAAAMASVVVALAGPERVEVVEETVLEGRGMGLVVDLSSSMLAEDMGEGASRIGLAREAAVRFARRRTYDELSLVGFGREAVTRVPPTRDSELIVQAVETLEVQLVRDGTDISGAMLTAIARLMESDREPRVVVLLTDGAHNGPDVPPLVTARVAESMGVRIHAISVVSPDDVQTSLAASIVQQRFGSERETVLQRLSGLTGGQYFRASGPAALDSIYGEIDRMEAPVGRTVAAELRHPLAAWFFMLALALLAAEGLLRGSRWGVVH